MSHIGRIVIHADRFPTAEHFPFHLPVLRQTPAVELDRAVTFFVGENGSGKSTLLEAVARRCNIHIWGGEQWSRAQPNPYEQLLHRFIEVRWTDGMVPGSFFAGQFFRRFAELVDLWASTDPGQLRYFGGESLVSQSHGEGLMSFFESRYRIPGLYLLDEPETALSPRTQVRLVRLLREMAAAGHAQFLIATHSPILLACPGATIYSFDNVPLRPVAYRDTEHFQVFRDFLADPEGHFDSEGGDA